MANGALRKKWRAPSASTWYGGGQDYSPPQRWGNSGRQQSFSFGTSHHAHREPTWKGQWQRDRAQAGRRCYVSCLGYGTLCRGWAWEDAQRPWCRTCGCAILPRKSEPWEERSLDDDDYEDIGDAASMEDVQGPGEDYTHDWNAEGLGSMQPGTRKPGMDDPKGKKKEDANEPSDIDKFGMLQKFLTQLWGRETRTLFYASFKKAEDKAEEDEGEEHQNNRTSRKELTRHIQVLANEKDAIKKAIGRIDTKISKLGKSLETARKQRANFRERIEEVEARYQKSFTTLAALDANPSDDDHNDDDDGADEADEGTNTSPEHYDMVTEELREEQTWEQTSGGRRRRTENSSNWASQELRTAAASSQLQLSGPKFFRAKAKSSAAAAAATSLASDDKNGLRRKMQNIRIPEGKAAKLKALLEDALQQAQQRIDELYANDGQEEDDY